MIHVWELMTEPRIRPERFTTQPGEVRIESWFSEVWRELARPRERAEWTDPVIEGEV